MAESIEPVIDISQLPLDPFADGSLYASADAGISERGGLTQIGAAYSEVPPGKTGCPFHVHHIEDELFYVIAGTGEYRFGDETFPVGPGCVLCAPRGGAEFAHQLINTGSVPLKYLSISSKAEADICEYPDSEKFQVMSRRDLPADRRFRFIGRMSAHLDYYDGEAGQ
ncbi:MAG: cupin domain-containing protein [Pseudomonadales bacterium]